MAAATTLPSAIRCTNNYTRCISHTDVSHTFALTTHRVVIGFFVIRLATRNGWIGGGIVFVWQRVGLHFFTKCFAGLGGGFLGLSVVVVSIYLSRLWQGWCKVYPMVVQQGLGGNSYV